MTSQAAHGCVGEAAANPALGIAKGKANTGTLIGGSARELGVQCSLELIGRNQLATLDSDRRTGAGRKQQLAGEHSDDQGGGNR